MGITKMANPYLSVCLIISLLVILSIKALLTIGLILWGPIHLGPDEAQYWTWSQYLDWGYYSKPPGIAWQIWLGTQLFGNTELGVRFLSVLFGFLISICTYGLARICLLAPTTAFWAALLMAFSPLGIMASLLAITDVGMVLFWTVACLIICAALAKERAPNYYLLGFVILCGALFKWPAYLFWILVIACCLPYRFLLNRHLIGGILLSLLGLAPSIFWNQTHHWVTFRHVWATIEGRVEEGATPLSQGNLVEFIAAQAALLSPILFALLILAFIVLVKQQRKAISAPVLFCGASSLAILLMFCIVSTRQKIQGNWCDFAYPSALVFLSWYASQTIVRMKWLKGGLIFSALFSLLALSIPSMQKHYHMPYQINPFRHNMGWSHLSDSLISAGYNPRDHFLFSNRYQMSSLLSFYGPLQKRAYFLNLDGIRLNQFSFWASMAEEQKGKTGFFVITENKPIQNLDSLITSYEQKLTKYFKSVTLVRNFPLWEHHGEVYKHALVFQCIGYNGLEPRKAELY